MTTAYDDRYDDAEGASSPSRDRSAESASSLHVVDFAPAPAAAPTITPDGGDLRTGQRQAERSRPTYDGPREKRTGPGTGWSRRRLSGLDGLRAIAVMAVVAFHLDFSLLPGGFLGVDVFFVISGFLITNLIASEILDSGRLRLGAFYLRRARRLLPTVLVLLAVVTVAGSTLWRDQLSTLRGGVLSSLTYVTNWWLIADKQSYFVATGRPPMLQHLWSLAIEEQFYLLWTVAVALLAGGVLAVRRDMDPRRRMRVVIWCAIALALVSTLLMAWHAEQQDLPYGGSTSRVYFGSDTHSMGLFLGSAFGAWLALQHMARPPVARRLRSMWSRLGLLGTDLVGVAAVGTAVYQFVHIDEYTPGLYRGGFLALDAVVLLAIVCAVRPGSLFGRVLDVRPIRWVGQRSYSIYIWHWPVCVVTRPDLDVHGSTLWINIARLAVILGLSTLSYRFIEVPLRSGRLGSRSAWRARARGEHRNGWLVASIATTLVATLALVSNPAFSGPALVARAAQHQTPPTAPAHGSKTSPHSVSASPGPSTAPHPSASSRSHRPTAPPGATTRPPAKLSISAFGDSVLLGAKDTLRHRAARLDLDAVEGRQAYDVLNDVLAQARAHTLRPYVLIHVGDNGPIKPDQLRATLKALSDRTRVVLMTLRVPRDWQDVNNSIIRSIGKTFPNVYIDDWQSQSANRTDWLYTDGIHLRPAGETAYAQIVMRAFRAKLN